MAEHINDGGPAFPCEQGYIPERGWNQTFCPGLTVRDYFAAHAPEMSDQWWEDAMDEGLHWAQADASWRYFHADAMLAEREKGARSDG